MLFGKMRVYCPPSSVQSLCPLALIIKQTETSKEKPTAVGQMFLNNNMNKSIRITPSRACDTIMNIKCNKRREPPSRVFVEKGGVEPLHLSQSVEDSVEVSSRRYCLAFAVPIPRLYKKEAAGATQLTDNS